MDPVIGGSFTLVTEEAGVRRRLASVAPISGLGISTENIYDDPVEFSLFTNPFRDFPHLLGVDLTVSMRLLFPTGGGGELYRLSIEPPAPSVEQVIERALGDLPTADAARLALEIATAMRKAGVL